MEHAGYSEVSRWDAKATGIQLAAWKGNRQQAVAVSLHITQLLIGERVGVRAGEVACGSQNLCDPEQENALVGCSTPQLHSMNPVIQASVGEGPSQRRRAACRIHLHKIGDGGRHRPTELLRGSVDVSDRALVFATH